MALKDADKQLLEKLSVLVQKLGGSEAEVNQIQSKKFITVPFLFKMVRLIDRLGGVVGDTHTILNWRHNLPDYVVLTDLDALISIADGPGSLSRAAREKSS